MNSHRDGQGAGSRKTGASMRGEVIWMIRDARDLKANEKAFLFVCESRGEMTAKRERCYGDMGMGKDAFYAARDSLIAKGLITAREVVGGTTRYRVSAEALARYVPDPSGNPELNDHTHPNMTDTTRPEKPDTPVLEIRTPPSGNLILKGDSKNTIKNNLEVDQPTTAAKDSEVTFKSPPSPPEGSEWRVQVWGCALCGQGGREHILYRDTDCLVYECELTGYLITTPYTPVPAVERGLGAHYEVSRDKRAEPIKVVEQADAS